MSAESENKSIFAVGIGASAGGLGPLRNLFGALSKDSPMSFIVVQHLADTGDNLLVDLLRKRSKIPVSRASHNTRIKPGHAYIAPPQVIVTVKGDRLQVRSVEGKKERRRTIDPMFGSLAEEYGERAVGIILSGNDSDGTIGLGDIARGGGLTIAQSPESAEFPTMPQSAVESGVIDLELLPGKMAGELDIYFEAVRKSLRSDKEIEQEAIIERLKDISLIVCRETGHDFSHYKTSTLVRRIQRRMRVLHHSEIDSYVAHLQEDKEEVAKLFKEILINVTSFFRDAEVFVTLADKVFPEMLSGRNPEDTLRVWVPGCASGEEAYTIGILLLEALDEVEESSRPSVKIFATDIAADALQVARRGSYPLSVKERLSEERVQRFFEIEDDRLVVIKKLRELCLFAEHNLIRDPPFVDLDLISCRNLLIYLNPDLQKQVLLLFHNSLRHEGFLFLGTSETVSPASDLFRSFDTRHRIWKNTSKTGADRPNLPMLGRDGGGEDDSFSVSHLEEPRQGDLHDQFQSVLAEEYAPRAVLVRQDGSIVYASNRLERYLQILRGKFHNNLIKMVSSGLRLGIRAALKKSIDTGERVVHDNLTFKSPEGTQPARVIVEPMPETEESAGLYLVVIEETGPPVHQIQESLRDTDEEAEKIINQLEHELEQTRENLEQTVQDLETSNEELKSSNEELRSMNEELQSANEELEASKDEVEEANNELSRAKEDLENLLYSAKLATLFLNDDHEVQLFTPAITEIYRLRSSDIGRPLFEITDHATEMAPLPDGKELGDRGEPQIDEVHTTDGTWYIRRVFSYIDSEDQRRGMVVTFSDVTELKAVSEQLRRRSRDLEEAMRKAESANKAKSEFLANMSHEIRTPMTAILGFADILLRRIEDPDDCRAVETIQRNANFLLDIINDILDVAKIEEGAVEVDLQAVDPRELIGDLISLMEARAREKHLNLSVEIDEEVPDLLELDPTRIRQILLNLVGNAIKFTEEGSVHVRVECGDDEERALRCVIVDTGIGMSEEEQREIFEPFTQSDTSGSRKHEGTGLGLTISRRLAEHLGGSLKVESELGEGSRFILEVPTRVLTEEETRRFSHRLAEESENPLELDARVLVVDDREEIRYLVEHFLERAGAEVSTVASGQEALEKAMASREEGREFDAVVMDMQMPDLDGYETTRRLRKSGFENPVLALTASAMLGDSTRCFQAGCTDYMTKPVDPDKLVRQICEYITSDLDINFVEEPGISQKSPDSQVRKKVLLVEDNVDVCDAMRMILQQEGFEIRCANDGADAIEAATSYLPDVVFLDLGLPDISGYEVFDELRNKPGLGDTIFVAITGRGRAEDIQRSKEAGFDDHLVKPAAIDELIKIIRGGR